jgi:hypothetical protein
MPRDDTDRLTLNGDEDHEGTIDAAVIKELTQHVRWSARALGKIEGFFDQIAKTSEASQLRMEATAKDLQETQKAELAEVKTTLLELTSRMARLESTVRELKITDEGLVQECNRKWENCQSPAVVQPSEPPSTTTTMTTPTTWYSQLLMGLFKQPIYLAIAGLIVAFVILALALSDDLRSLLESFSG